MKPYVKGVYDFIHAGDVFDDDNNGYVFGIYWLDEFDNVEDVTWYKTEIERENDLKEVLIQLKEV